MTPRTPRTPVSPAETAASQQTRSVAPDVSVPVQGGLNASTWAAVTKQGLEASSWRSADSEPAKRKNKKNKHTQKRGVIDGKWQNVPNDWVPPAHAKRAVAATPEVLAVQQLPESELAALLKPENFDWAEEMEEEEVARTRGAGTPAAAPPSDLPCQSKKASASQATEPSELVPPTRVVPSLQEKTKPREPPSNVQSHSKNVSAPQVAEPSVVLSVPLSRVVLAPQEKTKPREERQILPAASPPRKPAIAAPPLPLVATPIAASILKEHDLRVNTLIEELAEAYESRRKAQRRAILLALPSVSKYLPGNANK